MGQLNVNWKGKVSADTWLYWVTSEGCPAPRRDKSASFLPVTFRPTINCVCLSAFIIKIAESLTAQVRLIPTGWSMRSDNDLTLGPMSIRKCLEPRVNCCSRLSWACPWVRCLVLLTLSARCVGQRADPERKAHNSRCKNTLGRANEPFRWLLWMLNIAQGSRHTVTPSPPSSLLYLSRHFGRNSQSLANLLTELMKHYKQPDGTQWLHLSGSTHIIHPFFFQ